MQSKYTDNHVWTQKEDDMLVEAAETCAAGKWNEISKLLATKGVF